MASDRSAAFDKISYIYSGLLPSIEYG